MRATKLTAALALVLSLVATAIAATPARATISLNVSPALLELEAKPGGTGEQQITVTNNGDEPLSLAVAVEPYRNAAGDQSALDWLRVETADLDIPPGDKKTVTVTIAVPDGLESGGRYAAVTFTTAAKASGGGAAMAGKVGVPFMIAVKGKGKLTHQADITHFAPVLTQDGRVAFVAQIQNTGNLHLRPTGAIEIQKADGAPLGKLDFQETIAILPGSDGLLVTEGSLPLDPAQRYRAETALDLGAKKPAKAGLDFQPVPALAIEGVTICENLDRGPTVRVGLRNDGDLGLQPGVQVAVHDANGNVLGGGLPRNQSFAWPGEPSEIALDLEQRLDSGQYTLALRVDPAPPDLEGRTAVPPLEQEIPFQVGGLGGEAIPLCGA